MAGVSPYPHIKMGVRDESIFIGLDTEILPLDRPLYMMRCQKGRIGVPVWCPSFTAATLEFGTETFNKRSKYWSEQSYFLMKTLTKNGAFIMRVAEERAVESKVIIECGLRKTDVPQWQRNSITGMFVRDTSGNRIKIDVNNEIVGEVEGVEHGRITQEEFNAMTDKGVYKTSTDQFIDSKKTYFTREYAKYKYTPFKGTTADADMLLWCEDTSKATGENKTEFEAVAFDDITPEFLQKNFLFRTAVEEDCYVEVNKDDGVDADTEYFKLVDGTFVAIEDDEFTTTEDGTKKFPEGDVYVAATYDDKPIVKGETIVPVTDIVHLSAEYDYFRIVIKAWVADIFQKGALVDANKFYVRTPILSSGYTHTPIEGLEDKDKVDANNSIYRKDDEGNYTEYLGNWGPLYIKVKDLKVGDYKPQATIPGYEVCWRATTRSKEELEDRPMNSAIESTSDGYTWYPMLAFEADNAGEWGNSFGFRFYNNRNENTVSSIVTNGAVKYTIAPVELKPDATTPSPIVNAYGESTVVGTIKAGVVDKATDLEISLKKLIPAQYSGSRELPCSTIIIDENFEKVGKKLMEAEIEARELITSLYEECDFMLEDPDTKVRTAPIFTDELLATVDDVYSVEDAGYMADVVNCVGGDRIPYFASGVVGTFDEATGKMNPVAEAIDMNDESAFYLKEGTDGKIEDHDVEFMIREMIDGAVSQTNDYLVDYLRCPFNNVIDTGVSLATKKSYLDFMNVRDNLTVFLTPQQIWKNEDGTTPKQLTRYEDESVGAALRSYGLLMREDIENCTEANRACIFLASGVNSDHDYANDGLCASTLWIALKNAAYYNGTFIRDELGERPNSEITCYDGGLTWTAASEETRSRCWNAGLNYAQYAEQTVIHYASVRSIYRYDTSVLCDIGTVRAVTFAKDIIRKEWAIWAGSKRKADELNTKITKALNEKVNHMLNNKYSFSVNVYQTDEDKKYGYVRHVDLTIESPAQNRVWLTTIICRREGYDPEAADNK